MHSKRAELVPCHSALLDFTSLSLQRQRNFMKYEEPDSSGHESYILWGLRPEDGKLEGFWGPQRKSTG